MTQPITDLIRMIREHPEKWYPMSSRDTVLRGSQARVNEGIATGIGQIKVYRHLPPVINGVHIPELSFWDRYRLDRTIKWWYKRAPLTVFETVHTPA